LRQELEEVVQKGNKKYNEMLVQQMTTVVGRVVVDEDDNER